MKERKKKKKRKKKEKRKKKKKERKRKRKRKRERQNGNGNGRSAQGNTSLCKWPWKRSKVTIFSKLVTFWDRRFSSRQIDEKTFRSNSFSVSRDSNEISRGANLSISILIFETTFSVKSIASSLKRGEA